MIRRLGSNPYLTVYMAVILTAVLLLLLFGER
jgi:hypothetical protein